MFSHYYKEEELLNYIINEFKNVNDDYVLEGLWNSLYSSMLIVDNNQYTRFLIDSIYNNYIKIKKIPCNISINECFWNLALYAQNKNIFDYDMNDFKVYNNKRDNINLENIILETTVSKYSKEQNKEIYDYINDSLSDFKNGS